MANAGIGSLPKMMITSPSIPCMAQVVVERQRCTIQRRMPTTTSHSTRLTSGAQRIRCSVPAHEPP
jgi:hypothetical protein